MASRTRVWRLAGLVLLLAAAVRLAGTAQEVEPAAATPEAPEAVVRWLGEHAVRLATVEAGHGFEEMKPLRAMVGDARVVALGEATHGSRELFQLKHRMLEYLVEEMGFTAFAIEATLPEAVEIDRYVLTGEGDPARALTALYFWTWNTQEVLELIHWMRRYDADPAHRRKVRFYGFDMQFPVRAVKVALGSLRRADPAAAAALEPTLGVLADPFTAETFLTLPQERMEELRAGVEALLARLEERSGAQPPDGDPEVWDLAHRHARVAAQYLAMVMAPEGDFGVRDRAMAENVRWILEREGPAGKVVLWAHNGHVSREAAEVFEPMGYHLARELGSAYRAFGFAFDQGGFQAREMPLETRGGLRTFQVGPAPPGSLDATLARAGLEVAALDLRNLPHEGPVAEWLAEPHLTRSIGAGYGEAWADRFFDPAIVPRRYDALLFVARTTAARPNPGGRRPGRQPLPRVENPGFEAGPAGGSPSGWPPPGWDVPFEQPDYGFTVTTSEESPYQGERCAVLARTPGPAYGEAYGRLSQTVDATPFQDAPVRLRAAVEARLPGPGDRVYLWLRVRRQGFGPGAVAAFEYLAVAAGGWREREIVVRVPPDAATLDYGLALVGHGRAGLDAVSVTAEPEPPARP